MADFTTVEHRQTEFRELTLYLKQNKIEEVLTHMTRFLYKSLDCIITNDHMKIKFSRIVNDQFRKLLLPDRKLFMRGLDTNAIVARLYTAASKSLSFRFPQTIKHTYRSSNNGKLLCANCITLHDHIQVCGGCKVVYYCGASCQATHWQLKHKNCCKNIQTNLSEMMRTRDSICQSISMCWLLYETNQDSAPSRVISIFPTPPQMQLHTSLLK